MKPFMLSLIFLMVGCVGGIRVSDAAPEDPNDPIKISEPQGEGFDPPIFEPIKICDFSTGMILSKRYIILVDDDQDKILRAACVRDPNCVDIRKISEEIPAEKLP